MGSNTVLVAGADHNRFTLGRMCARGFASLGHEVHYADTNTRSIPILGTDISVSRMHQRLVRTASRVNPDLVFVIKGSRLPRSVIDRVKTDCGATVCNWNPDNPFMTRSTERTLDTYLDALPAYDTAFIWSTALEPRLRSHGAERVVHLPFAYDPTVHYPTACMEDFDADVVFAGHPSPQRKEYIKSLTDLDIDLAVYGDYWNRWRMDRKIKPYVRGGNLWGEEYCAAYCSADIVVNIVSDHNLDAYNMRTFEIPATGSLMATTRTTGQRDIFGEGQGMVCFETPAELKETVETYLGSDDRTSIAETGHKRVQGHTYENRMRTVMASVEEVQ